MRTKLTDRKSTRLNSSHANISYAVFCLKKKKKNVIHRRRHEKHSTSTVARATPHAARRGRYIFVPPRPRAHQPSLHFFFFFKERAAPRFFPFSPPRPFPL